MNEIEKQQAICLLLIDQCRKTNAEEMRVEQKGVTKEGEAIGDWEIIVRKITPL